MKLVVFGDRPSCIVVDIEIAIFILLLKNLEFILFNRYDLKHRNRLKNKNFISNNNEKYQT